VSLYRTAVLGFFTDKNSTTSDDLLFQGTYLFFKDGEQLFPCPAWITSLPGKVGGGDLSPLSGAPPAAS
jgi:hypothetical protein